MFSRADKTYVLNCTQTRLRRVHFEPEGAEQLLRSGPRLQGRKRERVTKMFERSFSWAPWHSERLAGLGFFAALVLLALTVLGFEARADDAEQSLSTSADSSPALHQVARLHPATAKYQDVAIAPGFAGFDAPSLKHDTQPLSQGLDLSLDFSLQRIGDLEDALDDSEQDRARSARIASCYESSVGRYHSEERRVAFTNPLSRTGDLDVAMTRFTAKRDSRRQFDTCSRF